MEYNRIRAVIPKPCANCSRQELTWLRDKHRESDEAHWIYTIPVYTGCKRCETEPRGLESRDSVFRRYAPMIASMCCPVIRAVQVPIPLKTVGLVERAIHAASVAEKGSEYRAHGTFIHHLSMLPEDEETKQALCVWAPAAMGGYMSGQYGVTRRYSAAKLAQPAPAIQEGGKSQDSSTAAATSATEKPTPTPASAGNSPKTVDSPTMIDHLDGRGNPDVQDGAMKGSLLKGDEYGKEDRVLNSEHLTELYGPPPEKVMARQIGPDLIPTEVFQSALGNLKCGLAKRVQPLKYTASKELESKIGRTVTKLIAEVFSAKKIIEWREENAELCEMASKKWSGRRFQNAFTSLLSDSIEGKSISHEFMIKENEALPAKGKAPRPIITSGDEGQIAMLLPVKCFESLLFKHFKQASIKGVDKHKAMQRVAKRLRGKDNRNNNAVTVIEGDGSAWDACCNSRIRTLTENRIIEHIVEVLGEDPEVPRGWMQQCLSDMKKKKLYGKAKVGEKKKKNPLRVVIDAIRQSGHRGTSAFNWLINYVGWMAVMCAYPEDMVSIVKGELRVNYKSAFDGCWYELRYAFEGDDSALTTNETITPERQSQIENDWTSLGFRMKLVFGSRKMTFTGFDFLCDEHGPTQTFIPELARNIASSSWTTSAEAKSHPERLHSIGAAAMLARAENFVDCGPFSRYFAELGLAHCRAGGDCEIGEQAAMALGIAPAESVERRLNEASLCAQPMTDEMRELVQLTCKLNHEQEVNLLSCHFGERWAPSEARHLIPLELWDPGSFSTARR